MRRTLSIRRGLAAALLALLVTALATASAGAKSGGHGGRQAANIAAARADAKALLGRVSLPAGATQVANASATPPQVTPTSAGARDESTWDVPGETPSQVMAYLAAHLPTGSTAAGTGSTSSPSGSSLDAQFSFPDVPGVIDLREVIVSASASADGGSRVTVESESVWVVLRSAASMIPAGTASVRATVTNAKGATLKTATIQTGARVKPVVKFFDGLEAGQPFVLACPLELTNDNTLNVTFLSSKGTILANATWTEVKGGDSGACSAVGLHVRGRDEGIIYGGDYLRSLNRLFATTFPGG